MPRYILKPLHLLLCAISVVAAGCASEPTGMSLNERRTDVLLQAVSDALERKDYSGALKDLNQAVKYSPKSPMVWSNFGIAYVGKGEPARGEESWKKALQFDPTFNDARLNLGIFYIQNKRYPEAERVLREASKDLSYTNLHLIAYNLGAMYLVLHKPLMAEQQFKIAVKENRAYCPAWMQLGLLQKERGDYAQAAKSFEGSVMGTCYKNPKAHYEIATLYLKAQETALAKTKLLEIIQLFPTSEWAKRASNTLQMIR